MIIMCHARCISYHGKHIAACMYQSNMCYTLNLYNISNIISIKTVVVWLHI